MTRIGHPDAEPHDSAPSSASIGDPEAGAAAWSEGGLLVLPRHGAALPDRCVVCNAPASGFAQPTHYTTRLARFPTRVRLGLCPAHRRSRAVGILSGRLIKLVGFFCLLVSLGTANQPRQLSRSLFLLATVLVILGTWVEVRSRSILKARGIDGRLIRLAGAHPGYLRELAGQPASIHADGFDGRG